MAGLGESASGAGGLFSARARIQYAAIASMRWSAFRNSLRSTRGALELGARVVTTLVFSVIGLAIAAGIGAGSYFLVLNGRWAFFPLLLWAVFFIWQMIPITLASFQEQFDTSGLLRFPVSFGTFYVLHLVFGLVDAATIVGSLCCAGIWIGVTLARPVLTGWIALALILFGLFNVLLSRAILSWIDRWLAQRRTREIVTAIFFVGLLSLQFLNPALREHTGHMSAETRAESVRWMHKANALQHWLPPGLAAETARGAGNGHYGSALGALALLGLFTLATGAVLGMRLGAEFRGENLGEAPSRAKAPRQQSRALIDGSGPIAAVLEKELRTVMRAIPLLYQIAAPIFVVFVLATVNRNRDMGSFHLPLGLLLALAYAFLGFTQMIYNNLGGEGFGIQLLFLSPTSIRTVLMGKNIFHAALFAVDALVVSIVACWRFGTPGPDALAASAAWVVFALPLHLAAGNIFSLTMPYKINLGRMGRQKGSQGNALLSMLVQMGALGVGAAVFALCQYFGLLWVAAPVFLLLAIASAIVWIQVLHRADRIANARRDQLVATLAKAD